MANTNPIVAAAAHFAANEITNNKAEIDSLIDSGAKLLVENGTKLGEEAAAKLPAVASGAIDGLLTQFGSQAETVVENGAEWAVDDLVAWLNNLAGTAAPAAEPAPSEAAPAEAAPASEPSA